MLIESDKIAELVIQTVQKITEMPQKSMMFHAHCHYCITLNNSKEEISYNFELRKKKRKEKKEATEERDQGGTAHFNNKFAKRG